MLKKLRVKMILICSSITATILTIVCLIAFYIFYQHYEKETKATLNNQLNTIVVSLQQNQHISHSYFREIATRHRLLIHIEDNGHPILFNNLYETADVQEALFNEANDIATNTYAFNLNPSYISSLDLPSIIFKFRGINEKKYLTAITLLPTKNGYCQILLLQDLTPQQTYIFYMQLLFAGLVLLGTLLLIVFSFFFVGMAMKPIEKSNQKQAEFIAAASHELRAPLTVIEAGMSSLHYENDPQSTHFIKLMQSECTRMKGLISDLLLLARSDAHQWQIHLDKLEVDSLLIELYDSFYPLYQDKHIHFSLDLPDDLLPPVLGDGNRIKQALTILLDNALSYVPTGKSVTLSTGLTSKYLKLQVVDTGIGISDEDKAHIFERFYQGDRSRHEKNHYGLGLSIAYEIIQLHNGQFSLLDTPGGGCTFEICIPLAS